MKIKKEIDPFGGEIDRDERVEIKTEKSKIEEKKEEMVLLEKNKIVKIENLKKEEKKTLRQKVTRKGIYPLIDPQKIQKIVKGEKLPQKKTVFILKIKKDKEPSVLKEVKILKRFKAGDFEFLLVLVPFSLIKELLLSPDILMIGEKDRIEEIILEMIEVWKKERDEKIKKLKLSKTHKDIGEKEKLEEYLQKESENLWGEKISSPYQKFVTPDAPSVIKISSGLSREEIYQKAVSFVWVSDKLLNGVEEKWLLPEEFLINTPSYPTNPLPGKIVSDCSEQANTLVSMLRQIGVPPEDVRVVLGKVNFGGEIGGHAWVEIKEDGEWLVLDPTSGPYFDEDLKEEVKREGLPYDFWKYHPYPVIEIWAYYNDVYFSSDPQKEVALGWSKTALDSQKARIEKEINEAIEKEEESVWQKIIDFFRSFLKKIKEFFKNLFSSLSLNFENI